MPTYDFRCGACGHEFERRSNTAERDEKAVCPKCGSRRVQTVIRAFSIGLPRNGGALLGAPEP